MTRFLAALYENALTRLIRRRCRKLSPTNRRDSSFIPALSRNAMILARGTNIIPPEDLASKRNARHRQEVLYKEDLGCASTTARTKLRSIFIGCTYAIDGLNAWDAEVMDVDEQVAILRKRPAAFAIAVERRNFVIAVPKAGGTAVASKITVHDARRATRSSGRIRLCVD
jgi:hypothetical protein